MDHLITENFWELMYGIAGTNEWEKLNNHLQTCEECQATHRLLLKVEDDIRSTPRLSSGFALRVSAAVRVAESQRLFNRPVFILFRVTWVTSILVCVLCLITLISGVQDQWLSMVDFNIQLISINVRYYFIAAAVFFLIWFADRFLRPQRNFNS